MFYFLSYFAQETGLTSGQIAGISVALIFVIGLLLSLWFSGICVGGAKVGIYSPVEKGEGTPELGEGRKVDVRVQSKRGKKSKQVAPLEDLGEGHMSYPDAGVYGGQGRETLDAAAFESGAVGSNSADGPAQAGSGDVELKRRGQAGISFHAATE